MLPGQADTVRDTGVVYANLILGAMATAAAIATVVVMWLQWKDARGKGDEEPAPEPSGMSVLAPTGELPEEVRGRDWLLRELHRALRRPSGAAVVLAGMGGVGKSTLAAALAERAQRAGRWGRATLVWWVPVAEVASLTGGLVTVARQLGAAPADIRAINDGTGDAPDRLWALLNRARRRWLLILDNADDPTVLAAWVRQTRRGLVLVTSRNANRGAWGRHARILLVDPLDEHAAARVLRDWAPQAGDQAQALELARRLGGLPLALRLAGSYLESDVALRTSFRDLLRALDDRDIRPGLLASAPSVGLAVNSRAVVGSTYEMSLDTLTARGVPQARPLLRLLSCYAVAAEIPLELLVPGRLAELLGAGPAVPPAAVQQRLNDGLRQLRQLSLIGVRPIGQAGPPSLVVHPVIADANRDYLNGAIRRTAVELVADAVVRLDFDSPADWPRYRLVTPHLAALCQTAAGGVDRDHLNDLLQAITMTARAHSVGGTAAAGEMLSRSALQDLASLADEAALLRLRHELAWQVAQRRPEEAEQMYHDGIASRRRLLGDEHPDTLMSRHELAWVTAVQGRWADAEVEYREVLDARSRVLGADHPDTLTTRHELAWAIANQGRGDEAEPVLREVLGARRRRLGNEHCRTLATRHELAWIAAVAGRWTQAEVEYREVLEARCSILGDDHPDTLTTRHELAWVLAGRGKRAAALAEYRAVLAARQRLLGDEHPDTVETDRCIERLRQGQTTQARHIA
jgi:tetratricopeptide (TPR) repeat protein